MPRFIYLILLYWLGLGMPFSGIGQTIHNVPPPLCGIAPGGEKYHVIKEGPKLFRGKLFNKKDIIPVDTLHHWFLYLEDQDGHPLDRAKIEVDGMNVEAGRGFATPPSVSSHIGNGHYVVKNVKYSVGGNWTMYFQVIQDKKVEILSFEVKIGVQK